MRTDDPRRAAEHCRDIGDSALIGAATDEPVSASRLPVRTFGQLPDLHVPEDFDEPLTDAENAVWEGRFSRLIRLQRMRQLGSRGSAMPLMRHSDEKR